MDIFEVNPNPPSKWEVEMMKLATVGQAAKALAHSATTLKMEPKELIGIVLTMANKYKEENENIIS